MVTSSDCVSPSGGSGDSPPLDPGAYRLPAEWHPHRGIWLAEPCNIESWPGLLDQAFEQFEQFAAALRQVVDVRTCQQVRIATDDSWVRDFGPIFVVREPAISPPGSSPRAISSPAWTLAGGASNAIPHPTPEADAPSLLACHVFRFNSWGGKWPCDDDSRVAQQIADHLGLPAWHHPAVVEGGAIETNGQGTIITTASCVLNPNRNPNLTRHDMQQLFHHCFNCPHVIWLEAGLTDDDTDGHVDNVARFLDTHVIAAPRAQRDHPDHANLELNWHRLTQARDPQGRPFDLVELPMPEAKWFDYPADGFYHAGPRKLAMSYANFLISNGTLFVPTFADPNDQVALRKLEQAAPWLRVTGIRADVLAIGGGTLHCLSMPQPLV